MLRPFVSADGAARVLITSNRRAVANLGTSVEVEVFSEEEALTFPGGPDRPGRSGGSRRGGR